jgi:histidinol-phosphate aminotransferase
VTNYRSAAPAGALRLHYNENTAGCSPAVLAAIRRITRHDAGHYPDVASIIERIERWFGLSSGWAQITNGLDEGIQMVTQCGVLHGTGTAVASGLTGERHAIVVEPTFEVYEMCATSMGAGVVRIPSEPEFRFPLERLCESIAPATRVIYLTDPNNPTGLGIPDGAVEQIASAAPQAFVLVDEAYADFSGRTLIGPLLERQRNVVIGRTFAKGHGIAGLRVGALVAHPSTLSRLRAMQLPFSVNYCAIAALDAALDDRTYLDWYVGESRTSRELVYDFCRRHGLTFWPSEANFVLFRVGPNASVITEALQARQILVRDKSSAPGCAGCIRLTSGVVEHTTLALAALEEILASRTR